MALHFGEKLCKSPFTHFRGSVADSLYIFWFQSVACFTIICQMALLPSRLSVAVENDASVHPVADKIKLCCNSCVPYCDWWSHVYAGVWLMEPCVCWSVIGWAVYMLVCDMVEPCVCWCVYGEAVCMLVCDWWSCVYAGWRLWVSGCGGICAVSQSAQEASEEARPSQGNHRVRSNLAAVCLLHTSIITCEIT